MAHLRADLANTRYKPFDQINAPTSTTWRSPGYSRPIILAPKPEYKLEGTPLMIGGMLYATAGTRRAVVALDAATGELLWMHSENEGERAQVAARKLSGRGLAYWSNGSESRVIYVTTGYRLISLKRENGCSRSQFWRERSCRPQGGRPGRYGPADRSGKGRNRAACNTDRGEGRGHRGVGLQRRLRAKTHNNSKGLVRAFDVRTGKLIWTFRTIPKPGEFGNDSWLDGSWATNGNTGVWRRFRWMKISAWRTCLWSCPRQTTTAAIVPGMGCSENRWLPSISRPASGNGTTSFVHHGLWDMDIPAAPILADINVDGRTIKAVAQPTKQGILYVFDRITGKPVWPIEEKPVEKSTVPGEWYSPTQPIPTKPKPYVRNGVTADEFIDFTPELHSQALQTAEHYKMGPSLRRPWSRLRGKSARSRWQPTPGEQCGQEDRTIRNAHFYIQACDACLGVAGLVQPKPEASDNNYVLHEGGGGVSVQGLPMIKPPYGTISAIQSGYRRIPVAGGTRRNTRCGAQTTRRSRTHDSAHRPGPQRGHAGDENAGDFGRSPVHYDARARARRDASRLRQGNRQGSRRRLYTCTTERISDDVHAQRETVHRPGNRGRNVPGAYIAFRLPNN